MLGPLGLNVPLRATNIPFGSTPGGVATGRGVVWLTSSSGRRVSAGSNPAVPMCHTSTSRAPDVKRHLLGEVLWPHTGFGSLKSEFDSPHPDWQRSQKIQDRLGQATYAALWPRAGIGIQGELKPPCRKACGFESHRGYVISESRGEVHLSVKIQGCDSCQTGSIPVPRPCVLVYVKNAPTKGRDGHDGHARSLNAPIAQRSEQQSYTLPVPSSNLGGRIAD